MTLTLPAMLVAIPLAAAAALAPPASAADKQAAPTVAVDNAWFATMPNNGPTYGYFRITNRGGEARLITGYASPACSSLKLEEAHGGGTNSKEAVSMTVAGHNRLVFSRGGYHLVCDRKADLRPGQSVPVTITLDGGTAIPAGFAVRSFPR